MIIRFLFFDTSGYPTKINKNLGISEPVSIDHYDFDGTQLKGKGKLYYPTVGEFNIAIQYGDEKKKQFNTFQLQGPKISIASQDVNLQIINNRRIFALTLVIIGLTLIQISKQFS